MDIKIALTGNPNCGKTTLFNLLTGSNQYVGNWPGVTVEKKEGKLKNREGVIVTDLPGIYSLSPYTPEEVVARNYLIDEEPSVILNIVDGTNLERNLYLTNQLSELGIPMVIAINMMDVVRKNGDKIDIELLSKSIGFKVIEISALKADGIDEAVEAAIEAAKGGKFVPRPCFSGLVEHAVAHLEEATVHSMPEEQQRWYAVKLFERDKEVIAKLGINDETLNHIEKDIVSVESALDDDAESIITNERYTYVENVLRGCYKKKSLGRLSISDKIDKVVTNRILAIPIFIAVMLLVYTVSIGTIGNLSVEFMNDTLFGEWIVPSVSAWLTDIGCRSWLVSLVSEGILGGVGSVLGFVPQMLLLFLMLSILEDIGYMSRVAFIMDMLFRKFGLSGKSFIPLLVASGCGVPGVMASRTIESERDRRMTIMTTCFIPCGAKMPLVGLVAGALFGGSPIIAASAYLIGIAAVILSGLILKKTKPFAGKPAPFVMELPPYHAPVACGVLRATWERGWDFIRKAGTVILAASIVIWTLNNLSFVGGFHYIGESGSKSILSYIGNALAVVFKPLGFGKWQAAVATILGLMAKEEVVGVFGALHGGAEEIALTVFDGNKLSAYSFMMFNLLCAPCVAAMGAIRREMNSPKWTVAAIGYMTAFAWFSSLVVYQVGTLITKGAFGFWTAIALMAVVAVIYLLFRKNKYENTL